MNGYELITEGRGRECLYLAAYLHQLCWNCLIEVAGILIFSQDVCLVARPAELLLPAVSSVVLTRASPGQGFT